MARKAYRKKPSRPAHMTERVFKRGFALRKLGFRNEAAYERWVEKYSALPESDPRHYRKDLPIPAREAEIRRIKRIAKRTVTPAKEIRRKANVLVYDLGKMSAFSFTDRYLKQIKQMLQDPTTSRYDRQILRDIVRKLEDRMHELPEALRPGEQGELFR